MAGAAAGVQGQCGSQPVARREPGTGFKVLPRRWVMADDGAHLQAILRLARRRINVLYAMLRDGAFYTARTITV